MKKYAALFLAIVCFSSLFSCTQHKTDEPKPNDTTSLVQSGDPHPSVPPIDFATFLENENFVEGLGQSTFINQIKKYSYDEKPISESLAGYFYDGPNGGGYRATGEHFGFTNDYTATQDNKSAIYTNRLYTDVPLDGLTLPHGVTFDDNLPAVLKKLGFDIDPKKDFVSDEGKSGTMTLHSDGNASIVLINPLAFAHLSSMQPFDYIVIYTEKYQTTYENGRVSDVTRTVSFSFKDTNKALGGFAVSVVETYEINQAQPN